MLHNEKIVFLLNSGFHKTSGFLFFSGLSLILASLLVLFYPMIFVFLFCAAGITAGAGLILLSLKSGRNSNACGKGYYRYF